MFAMAAVKKKKVFSATLKALNVSRKANYSCFFTIFAH